MNNLSDGQPERMSVCAIILDYFGADKTVACLTSLLDQGLDSVVVVDNSGDRQASAKLQEALAEFTHCKRPFAIHLMVNPTNLGFGAGMNKALNWLESNQPHQYYLLINNDAKSTPSMLTTLLQYMFDHKNMALIAPMIDAGCQMITGYWYQRLGGLIFSKPVIGAFHYLSGCCLLLDRRIIGNALFDEDFFMYGEDVELSWRLQLSCWKTACVSQAIVKHEGVGSSQQGGYFYEYHTVRGHILLARKIIKHQWEIPLFYLGRLLTLTARSLVRAIRLRSLVPVTASISAVKKIITSKINRE